MRFFFSKLQATGNDFIVVDNRVGQYPTHAPAVYERLCHRRFGIGADGVIFLQPGPDGHHYQMVYLNADGHPGSMCGNGGRCSVLFAHRLGLLPQGPGHTFDARFTAYDGPHQATLLPQAVAENGVVTAAVVSLQMGPASPLEALPDGGYFIDTGSPHYIRFLPDVATLHSYDVATHGAAIRYGPRFGPQGGTNVNFVVVEASGQLQMRTYERGVEAETFSCGTGVTASALAHAQLHGAPSPITVETPGGQLAVRWQGAQPGSTPWLVGPAVQVYDGVLDVDFGA